jgi:DNA-binding beta-propeller fold protein YncE
LKIFIIGGPTSSSLYVYSPLQQLQGPIALSGPATAISFSPNGAFAFIEQSAVGAIPANITAFSTCTNQVATDINGSQAAAVVNLPADPLMMRVLPNLHINGTDSLGIPIPDGVHLLVLDATGFDILTAAVSAPAAGTLCPQGLAFVPNAGSTQFQRIELGQQIAGPANFFASPDSTQLYVVNPSSSTILVYSFILGATSGGIQLQGDATPISSDISADGSTIAVAGSDGQVHNVSTQTGGADLSQTSFPNMPDYLNPFCSITPSAGPCTLSTVLVRP